MNFLDGFVYFNALKEAQKSQFGDCFMGKWFWHMLDGKNLPELAWNFRDYDWYVLRHAGVFFNKDHSVFARWTGASPELHVSTGKKRSDDKYSSVDRIIITLESDVDSRYSLSSESKERWEYRAKSIENAGVELKTVWTASCDFVWFAYRDSFSEGIKRLCVQKMGYYGI